jgi:hypothetical protein
VAIGGVPEAHPAFVAVVHRTSELMGVDFHAILSKDRTRDVVIARQAAMYVLGQAGRFTCTEIGNFFFTDHSTVLYAYKRIQAELKDESKYRRETLREVLKQIEDSAIHAIAEVDKQGPVKYQLRKPVEHVCLIPRHKVELTAEEEQSLSKVGTFVEGAWMVRASVCQSNNGQLPWRVKLIVDEHKGLYDYLWLEPVRKVAPPSSTGSVQAPPWNSVT